MFVPHSRPNALIELYKIWQEYSFFNCASMYIEGFLKFSNLRTKTGKKDTPCTLYTEKY